jgi:hypothetical protein
MSQYNDSGYKTFPVAAALGRYIRVKTPAGLVAAGLTDKEIGQIRDASFSADATASKPMTVILRTKPGTQPFVASAAITKGVSVYTAANGKISSTAATGALLIGIALEAATADGDVIEVLRDTSAA